MVNVHKLAELDATGAVEQQLADELTVLELRTILRLSKKHVTTSAEASLKQLAFREQILWSHRNGQISGGRVSLIVVLRSGHKVLGPA